MADPIEAKLRITAETGQAAAAVDQLGKKTTGLATDLGKAGAARPFDGLKAGAADADKAHQTAQKAVQRTAEETARKLRETQNQMRLLGPQITDIVTGLATGQSPFTVLLQQGGQLRDVFGGTGNALRALSSIFTTARVVFAATAGVLATVAFEAATGASEADALRKSLALTGNEAGRTIGQLDDLARRIATTQKASIGSVRETVQAVVDTGAFLGPTLDSAVRATTALNKLTGQTADETLKQFTALTAGVTAGAAKLNQSYNFLTADQVRYIRGLEAQGLAQEAIRFTLDELSQAIEQRSVPAIGLLERAWNGVKNAVSGALDGLKSIGREDTAEQKIKQLEARIKDAKARQAKGFGAVQLPEMEQQLAALRALVRSQGQAAEFTAAQAKANNDQILKDSKAFQDQLANLDQASAQKALAQRNASLDAQRAAIELSYAQGLTSAEANAIALNRIDQARLEAQAANVRRQIQIEQGRVLEKPGDDVARATRVTGLQAQLVSINGQIAATAARGQGIVESASLERARQNAKEWAAIWERAQNQIRNFSQQVTASQAKLLADPLDRAAAEAAAATAEARRQFETLERDLELQITLTLDPQQRELIEAQLAELRAKAGQAVGQNDRDARFASLNTQASERQARLAQQEAAIQADVQAGQLTTAEGERRILALRRDQLPAIQRIAAAMKALATSPDQQALVDKLEEEIRLQQRFQTEIEATARSSAIGGLSSALTDIVTGAKSGKAALLDMVNSFARAMLDVLNRRLAEALIDQFAKAASGTGGAGFWASIGNFVGNFFGSLFHEGGVVGAGGGTTRVVSPLAFALAPRYHAGGIGGLMPDEVPAILRKGEEELTEEDPRHRNNSRSFGGVSIQNNVSISGAQADDARAKAALDDLARTQEQAFDQWAVRQMRPGGLLAGLRGTR